jgi:hypothetical protein
MCGIPAHARLMTFAQVQVWLENKRWSRPHVRDDDSFIPRNNDCAVIRHCVWKDKWIERRPVHHPIDPEEPGKNGCSSSDNEKQTTPTTADVTVRSLGSAW